jgi:AraC-like DNA-binding protein/ligand-binding sensor protein
MTKIMVASAQLSRLGRCGTMHGDERTISGHRAALVVPQPAWFERLERRRNLCWSLRKSGHVRGIRTSVKQPLPMKRTAEIVGRIASSEIYKDYEHAFSEATHLPLAIRPVEVWRFALENKKYANPFCAMLAKYNRTCAACLETQKRMDDIPGAAPRTVTCFAGLCDSAVPVKVGESVIGYLQTGQVALRKPSSSQFKRIAKQLIEWGVTVDLGELEDAYHHSRCLAPQQYAAVVKLLETFGKHLSLLANQIVMQDEEAESPLARRARAYILANQADPIDLAKVAQAMHVSTFYFCKMFKKATGLTFTEYLGRVRVEKAKNLLLNPHLRISEIAYDVGFQSLTHFNRVFRQVVGQSPSEYRESKSARQMLN